MIESKRFQTGSLTLVKNKTTPDTWFLRFYEDEGEKRVYRRKRIGTIREFPHRRDAEKAVLSLRSKINNEVSSPETVKDLITHYQKYELTPARKAFTSIENHLTLTKCYISPRWGTFKLGAVRTVQVEEWLDSLELAPASKTKIKSAFSVLYSHAIRHEFVSLNPISKVRTSSKALREKDVLTPEEFRALLVELSVRDRAMVLLAGSTAVRRSELMALTWSDLDLQAMAVNITKSCVRNRFGNTKTDASRCPVPLHPLVLEALLDWKRESLYQGASDFLFPSIRLNGTKPLSPDSLLKKASDLHFCGLESLARSSAGIISAIRLERCLDPLERTSRRLSLCYVMPRVVSRWICTLTPSRSRSATPTTGWWNSSCLEGS